MVLPTLLRVNHSVLASSAIQEARELSDPRCATAGSRFRRGGSRSTSRPRISTRRGRSPPCRAVTSSGRVSVWAAIAAAKTKRKVDADRDHHDSQRDARQRETKRDRKHNWHVAVYKEKGSGDGQRDAAGHIRPDYETG